MRQLICKLLFFLSIAFVALNAVGWLLLKYNLQGHAVENSRIYTCLQKARSDQSASRFFVFGDSVANQMYPPEKCNGEINSLALVMPSTMAGQYLLLKRMTETTDIRGKAVVLVLVPSSFNTRLSEKASYHYVLKPFYNAEFSPWSDPFFSKRIASPGIASLSQLPLIKCSNWNPPSWLTYLNSDGSGGDSELGAAEGISEWSAHYLSKIDSLVKEKGGKLKVLPSFQRASLQTKTFENLKADITRLGFTSLFDSYFEQMIYFDDNLFADAAHLKNRAIAGGDILKLGQQ